jgi:hypothetical protein
VTDPLSHGRAECRYCAVHVKPVSSKTKILLMGSTSKGASTRWHEVAVDWRREVKQELEGPSRLPRKTLRTYKRRFKRDQSGALIITTTSLFL